MTAGFYSELFKLIDQYDGDTHMDTKMKETFTKNVIQPLGSLHESFVSVSFQICGDEVYYDSPKQMLALVLATHPKHYSLWCSGDDCDVQWPLRVYVDRFYNLTLGPYARIRLNEKDKIIEFCASNLTFPGEFWDPAYQKFIFYTNKSHAVPSGFRCITFD